MCLSILTAFPSGTLLLIIVLWFGISAPLSAIGSYFGSKHGVSSHGAARHVLC